MSYSHQHHQRELWGKTLENMDLETKDLVANLAVCAMILYLAAAGGANPTFSVGAIAFVQSVHIPRAIRAYRQAKYDIENASP